MLFVYSGNVIINGRCESERKCEHKREHKRKRKRERKRKQTRKHTRDASQNMKPKRAEEYENATKDTK